MTLEQREAFETLQKTVKEHEAQMAKMRDEAELSAAIQKVEKHWPSLPIKAREFGPVYRKIAKVLSPDELVRMVIVEKVFSSHAQFADIAGSTVGRGAQLVSGDVWTEAEAKAVQLRAKQPDLSADQAIAKVFEIEPDLYRRYMADLGSAQ